jgi:hypothetical protein
MWQALRTCGFDNANINGTFFAELWECFLQSIARLVCLSESKG